MIDNLSCDRVACTPSGGAVGASIKSSYKIFCIKCVILGLLNAKTLADSPCPTSFTGLIVKLYSTPASAKEYAKSKNNQESFILDKYSWHADSWHVDSCCITVGMWHCANKM